MHSILEAMGQTGSNNATIKNSGRTLVANKQSDSKQVPKTYYLNISITAKKSRAFNESTPKVRIKIPKLLVKTVKKRHGRNGTDHKTINNNSTVKKLVNHKKLLPIKVTSLLSNVTSGSKKCSVTRNGRNPGRKAEECQSGRATKDIFTKTAFEDTKWSRSTRSIISWKSGHQSFSHPPRIRDILKERLEINEEDVNQLGVNLEHAKQIITCKLPSSRMKMAFNSFFNKSTPLNLIKAKSGSRSSSSSHIHKSGKGIGSKEVSYKSSVKIESAEKEGDCNELCKKKILLGVRCRPVNFTGILHYDKNK